jgi:BASS family bile acid:Na+ symporter
MATLTNLLRNRNAILLLGLLCGLFLPFAVPLTRHFILVGLGLTMTLSTMEIGNDAFRSPRRILVPALIGIALNYLLLGSIQIALSSMFIRNEAIWTGLVLVAAVPPAIAIIPFSGILRGNPTLSLFGTVGAHLAALSITPLIAVGLLGAASFNPRKLLITLFFLIVVPLILSRLLIRPGIREWVTPLRGTITNWTFFFVFYTMVGLNRDFLLGKIGIVIPIAAILLTTTFVLGFLIDRTGILFHLSPETRTSLVLLGTLKNQANAGGLALTFFSQEAALPAAISSIVMMAYFIWLDFRKRRSGQRHTAPPEG